MKTYPQVKAEVMKIIKEPMPELVQQSYTPMSEVFRAAINELKIPDRSITVDAWEHFSRLTGGLREREFTVLCGPTGSGKTTLLANLAVQLISGLTPVFVASVETGQNDFMRKMISIVSGKETASGRSISDEEANQITEKFGKTFKIKNSVFSNYDSRVPHLTLLCDLLHAHEERGVKVALIDNLNFLMDVTDARNQVSDMDKAIHDFIVFCKTVPIHVIMVMHPRKTLNGRVENEFDIKGSSTAVQEASNVILWNRLDAENLPQFVRGPLDAPSSKPPYQFCREIKFAKVRKRGRSVGARIIFGLEGQGEYMKEIGVQ